MDRFELRHFQPLTAAEIGMYVVLTTLAVFAVALVVAAVLRIRRTP